MAVAAVLDLALIVTDGIIKRAIWVQWQNGRMNREVARLSTLPILPPRTESPLDSGTAGVQIQKMEDFGWLNASYVVVLTFGVVDVPEEAMATKLN